MDAANGRKVLVSGASIAGLSTAYWLNRLGYSVTVVEVANAPRTGGAAVNLNENALTIIRRMGLFESVKANALSAELWEFKNADDVTESSLPLKKEDTPASEEEIEIERDKLVHILYDSLKKDVDFSFNNSVTALTETETALNATFADGSQQEFHLVFGCDGAHSGIRKIWFGPETSYAHFLNHYFSLTIVDKLLIRQHTAQMYNVPGKVIMLNAYNNKTDIIFCFFSEKEIPYDYRNTGQQMQITADQFAGQGWKTEALLDEVKKSKTAYFDKFCQIKMPSWTKGRVALVGDAGYCASPAAGIGASLSILGAAAVADALEKHNGHFEPAFQEYNRDLRPFIDEVQATAVTTLNNYLIPKTEEAIRERNTQPVPF